MTQPPWAAQPPREPRYRRVSTKSTYVTMPDGVRIAVDVTLPTGAREVLPTILRQTRYHRRLALDAPFDRAPLRALVDQQFHARRYFVQRGYAWVDVCVRGSGASGGTRPTPWAPAERADGATLMDWIVAQPWSNGRIGARGVSYDGTCAEFLMWHGHPALRAIAPRFALFDVFEDIAMPGGVHLEQFTLNWRRFNAALDANDFSQALGLVFTLSQRGRAQLATSPYAQRIDPTAAQLLERTDTAIALLNRFVHGVAPTDDADAARFLNEHLTKRTPALDVNEAGRRMTFRDDRNLSDDDPDLNTDHFSPHAMLDGLPHTIPVFNYSGWYDGAYQRSAIKRFHALDDPGQRLIIGPWEHGGRQDISPWSDQREPLFDHNAELMRFFDAYLLTDHAAAQHAWLATPKVRYYTLGAERWQTADSWPPPGTRLERAHFAGPGTLGPTPQSGEAVVEVSAQQGTGAASRWRSLLPTLALTHYVRDRTQPGFESPRLTRACELTGHPIAHISAAANFDDPRLFIYLDDVAPNGETHYITEGQLRAVHRRVGATAPPSHRAMVYRTFLAADASPADRGQFVTYEFDLLPISYLLRAGHALRVVIAGNDRDNFAVGGTGALTLDLRNCWIDLPVRHGTFSFPEVQAL